MSTLSFEDDARLVAAIRQGDSNAANALWQRYTPLVVRMLRRSLGRSPDVEDLAQEVFLVVFQKVQGLRKPMALRAFIIAVTVNICGTEKRRRYARGKVQLPRLEATDGDFLARKAEARIALGRFFDVVGRLRPVDRAVATLRLIAMRELTDIAATLDMSMATVKRRAARGAAKVALLAERDPLLAQYRSDAVSRNERALAL